MPRKARIDAPGALQHNIVRGIEKKAVFRDSIDYRNFIDRFGKILLESRTPCFAWALMSNHAPLLLKTGMAPLSTVMRRLLTVTATGSELHISQIQFVFNAVDSSCQLFIFS